MEKHAIIFFSCLTRLTEELLRPGFLNRCVGFLRGLLLAAICLRSWLASLDLWLLCDCMLSSSARCCLEIGQERNHASPSTVTVYKGLGQLMRRHLMKCFDALADWVYILGYILVRQPTFSTSNLSSFKSSHNHFVKALMKHSMFLIHAWKKCYLKLQRKYMLNEEQWCKYSLYIDLLKRISYIPCTTL